MLTVADLKKRYHQTVALGGVDLHVDRGEIVALLGPNGAGKTTLVSIIAGLRRADAGTVTVGGVDALAHPQRARGMLGIAPQDVGIYPIVSVRRNLRLFAELGGVARRQITERIDEVATALSLHDLLDRQAGTLSGGQKRRLHTAIALLHRPALLLLDEPTAGADVATRADLLALVRHLADDGAAVLYSTHYMHEVEGLDATVVILDHGKVIAEGPLQSLLARHASAFVELTFDGPPPEALLGDGAKVDGATLRLAADEPARAAVEALNTLGDHAARLQSIEVVHPNLESVYLSVTGRRYDAEAEAEAREVVDVVAG